MSVHGVFRHRRRLSTLKTYRMLFIPNSSSHIYDLLLFQYKNIILNIKRKILSCLKSRPFLVNLVLSLFSTEISFDSFLSHLPLNILWLKFFHRQKGRMRIGEKDRRVLLHFTQRTTLPSAVHVE